MNRLFGWSYPPGCSGPPEWDDTPCDCCGLASGNCECPECPVCGEVGVPLCYEAEGKGHGMKYSKQQRIGQIKLKILDALAGIADDEMYLQWLEEQPDDWKDE